jgi:glycosyltransferase involved in cell wall biosynthesis
LKPTVLQLVDSFHQGGSERQAIQLTRLLAESGSFEVRLASLRAAGPLLGEAQRLRLGEIREFPLNNFYDWNAFVQLRRLINFLRHSRVDILHTHDFYTNIFGMTAGWFARVPVRIASMRETAEMRTPSQKRFQKFAYSLAHRVIANSEAVRKELVHQGIRSEKISVIYNGLDLSRLDQEASWRESVSLLDLPAPFTLGQPRFVTIIANMRHEVKDHPMFLRAAQIVNQKIPESAFLMAGEGDLIGQLRALTSELGIKHRTHFLGDCKNIGALLAISEVCVLSSKAEGFSNAILEYMAAARPVVATDVGGASEAIVENETGFLVQSGDHERMADRIIALLRDPEKARSMGKAGQRRVQNEFSVSIQLERTEYLYESLLLHQRAPK